jgi:hypothetical protein
MRIRLSSLVKLFSMNEEVENLASHNVNYSRKFNVVLIHVPKTGGTSFGRLFGIPSQSHHTYSEYCQSAFHKSNRGLQTIAFVRDPIERFISLYNYSRMPISYYHNNLEPTKSKYGKHLDYEVLRESSLDEAVDLLAAGNLKHDRSWLHWNPQVYWLLDRTGSKIGVDHVIRLEQATVVLANLFGIDPACIPRLNTSKPLEAEKLSARAKKILMNYYSDDYKYLEDDNTR